MASTSAATAPTLDGPFDTGETSALYRCCYCPDIEVSSEIDLLNHLHYDHVNYLPFKCQHCDTYFAQVQPAVKHAARHAWATQGTNLPLTVLKTTNPIKELRLEKLLTKCKTRRGTRSNLSSKDETQIKISESGVAGPNPEQDSESEDVKFLLSVPAPESCLVTLSKQEQIRHEKTPRAPSFERDAKSVMDERCAEQHQTSTPPKPTGAKQRRRLKSQSKSTQQTPMQLDDLYDNEMANPAVQTSTVPSETRSTPTQQQQHDVQEVGRTPSPSGLDSNAHTPSGPFDVSQTDHDPNLSLPRIAAANKVSVSTPKHDQTAKRPVKRKRPKESTTTGKKKTKLKVAQKDVSPSTPSETSPMPLPLSYFPSDSDTDDNFDDIITFETNCNLCSEAIELNGTELRNHVIDRHVDSGNVQVDMYQCQVCKRTFSTNDCRSSHLCRGRIKQLKTRDQIIIEIGQKCFPTLKHRLSCVELPQLKCICSAKVSLKAIARHILTHKKHMHEPMFACKLCHDKFHSEPDCSKHVLQQHKQHKNDVVVVHLQPRTQEYKRIRDEVWRCFHAYINMDLQTGKAVYA